MQETIQHDRPGEIGDVVEKTKEKKKPGGRREKGGGRKEGRGEEKKPNWREKVWSCEKKSFGFNGRFLLTARDREETRHNKCNRMDLVV
jgi:hypothetical protein